MEPTIYGARLYPLPRPAQSDEDDERLVHADLARLDADTLLHEHARVVHALALTDDKDRRRLDYLLERYRRVSAERRGREQSGSGVTNSARR